MRRFAFAAATITLLLALARPAAAAAPVVYVSSDAAEFTPAQVDAVLPAFQTMVSRDLQRWWGVDATLTSDPLLEPQAAMTLLVTDRPDLISNAEGMHWTWDGRPTAWVFADKCVAWREAIPLVATHELEEMLVDPWVNRLAVWASRTWLVEVSDPVEDGYYAYWIDGVPISDFITPAWYGSIIGKRVDHVGALKRPGQLGRHGYASWRDPFGGWRQVWA
jgi:hypothetical protein